MDRRCEITEIKIAGRDLSSVLIHRTLRKGLSRFNPQPARGQFGNRNRVSFDLEVGHDILRTFIHIKPKHRTCSVERRERRSNSYSTEAMRLIKLRQQFDAVVIISTSVQKTRFVRDHMLL